MPPKQIDIKQSTYEKIIPFLTNRRGGDGTLQLPGLQPDGRKTGGGYLPVGQRAERVPKAGRPDSQLG